MGWGVFTPATAMPLSLDQKHVLESLARAGITPQRLARKCEVILLAAEGVPNHAIARQSGLSRPTVIATRAVFARGGVEALRQRQKRKHCTPTSASWLNQVERWFDLITDKMIHRGTFHSVDELERAI
jgi:hypothetical protein